MSRGGCSSLQWKKGCRHRRASEEDWNRWKRKLRVRQFFACFTSRSIQWRRKGRTRHGGPTPFAESAKTRCMSYAVTLILIIIRASLWLTFPPISNIVQCISLSVINIRKITDQAVLQIDPIMRWRFNRDITIDDDNFVRIESPEDFRRRTTWRRAFKDFLFGRSIIKALTNPIYRENTRKRREFPRDHVDVPWCASPFLKGSPRSGERSTGFEGWIPLHTRNRISPREIRANRLIYS